MRIVHRFGFSSGRKDIVDFLKGLGAAYKEGGLVSTLDIAQDDAHFSEIVSFFEANGIHPVSEAVFSNAELESAGWLRVRSTWRCGYPLPSDGRKYISATYDTAHYCAKCGAGLVQKKCFALKKAPNWNSRSFLMLNWVHDELFVSQKAAGLLCDSGLSGFTVRDVLDKSGNRLDGIYQLYIPHALEDGLCTDSAGKVSICPDCGGKRHLLSAGRVHYKRSVFDRAPVDIVKSAELFGEIACCRMIFISQNFYQFLLAHKLERGLAFEPVGLVD